MRRSGRVTATFLTFVCATGALLSGQETPTFRTSVEGVQLSVIVTDADGHPVSGLTEADFELIENRMPRPITTFSAVDIPIIRTEAALAERDVIGNDGPPGRVYLIVLDQMHADLALRTRAFLRNFVEEYFGPNDTAAVVLTTRGLRDSGHEFTTNPRLLLNAIDKFYGGDGMANWEREKNFTQDLRDLLRAASTTRAPRTAVIFVSENIPVDPDLLVGYQPGAFGDRFSEVNSDFREAISLATRNSIAFYPVNPRGLASVPEEGGSSLWASLIYSTGSRTVGFSYSSGGSSGSSGSSGYSGGGGGYGGGGGGRSFLYESVPPKGLADLTGGLALANSNDFDGFLERVVRDNSTYYVLGFNSGAERRDGRYMDVEVRTTRPGLQVRSLAGYIAPQGKSKETKVPKSVLRATWDAVANPLTTSGVPMRMFAAPFRGDGKKATVEIALELDTDKLNLIEQDGLFKGEFEILFALSDATNKRHPIYRHRAEAAITPETHERINRTALRVTSRLPLPPGRYQLRASVGGAVTAGSVVYDLVVPDFTSDFAMSGVALTSTIAGETYTVTPPHKDRAVAFPSPPTTVREFSQDDTLTVFAEAYENRSKPHTVVFRAELRDKAGNVVGAVEREQASTAKPKRGSRYTFAPDLELSTVPPGRYALHIDVRSSLDQGTSLTHAIPIEVR